MPVVVYVNLYAISLDVSFRVCNWYSASKFCRYPLPQNVRKWNDSCVILLLNATLLESAVLCYFPPVILGSVWVVIFFCKSMVRVFDLAIWLIIRSQIMFLTNMKFTYCREWCITIEVCILLFRVMYLPGNCEAFYWEMQHFIPTIVVYITAPNWYCFQILDYLGKSSDSDPSSPVEHLSSRSRLGCVD